MRMLIFIAALVFGFTAKAQTVGGSAQPNMQTLGNVPYMAVPASGAVVPSILQRTSFSSLSNSVSGQGTNLMANGIVRFNFPSPTQTGNTALMGISARTTSPAVWAGIGDDVGNVYRQQTYGYDATGNQAIWWYAATNITAGTHFIYVTNGTVIMSNIVAVALEANDIIPYSPMDVTNTFTSAASGTISAGSITPTQTGDLILEWGVRYGTGSTIQSFWTAGSQANITWALTTVDVNDGHALQWGIDSATAAINPQMTCTVNATRYIAATIALKASATAQGVGRPAGMYVAGISHQSWPGPLVPAGRICVSQFPTVGNLLVLGCQAGGSLCYPTNATDTQGNTYTLAAGHPVVVHIQSGGANTCCVYASNLVASANLYVTNQVGQNGDMTIMAYDIVGASLYPFDYGVQQVINDNGQYTNGLALPHWFTPSVAGEFVLNQAQEVFMTTSNILGGNMRFDCEVWTNESRDGPSNPDQNNSWSHCITPDTSPIIIANYYQGLPTAPRGDMSFYMVGFLPSGGTAQASPKFFVQSTNIAAGSAVSSLSVQFPITNRAASLLVVAGGSVHGRTVTVTDSHNTYTVAQAPTDTGLAADDSWIYYASNSVAGANTVTVSISGATSSDLHYAIHEYAGFALYQPFDKTHTANMSSTTAFNSGNTAATSFTDELVFGLMVDSGNGLLVSVPSGESMGETVQPSALTTCDSFQRATGPASSSCTPRNATSGSMSVATFH